VTPAPPPAAEDGATALTIGDLAARTGMSPAVLRTWEARHGFPTPQRSPGGHRWYRESDVELVRRVAERQRAGVRLEAAIREIATVRAPSRSVFGTLRDAHPELSPQRLRKSTLLALSRAIEDDYLASADTGVVVGAFQRARFYRASRSRWSELRRRSRWALSLAGFSEARAQTADEPALVPLAAGAPMLSEWALVAETQRMGSCLAAWEAPGQDGVRDMEREFEVVWTVDPQATRTALRVCVDVAGASGLATAQELVADLDATPPAPMPDLLRVAALFNRTLAYADRAHRDPS
jgi:DICT domain-containing protein